MTENVRPDGKTAAALALARGQAVTEAATAAGVSDRTIRRWLANDPEFADHVRDLRGEVLTTVIGALTDASTKAVATLVDCLKADDPSVRVRAAAQILRALPSMRVEGEVAQQVAALEAALEAQQNGTRR